jgi:hypothetical protein
MPWNPDMDTPVTITFRNTAKLTALETLIQRRFARLTRFCPTVQGGRVVVERSDRRQRTGSDFHVHVLVKLPGEDIAVERHARVRSFRARGAASEDGTASEGLTDLSATVRRTFDAVRRRLQDHERVVRGDVKAHVAGRDRKRAS